MGMQQRMALVAAAALVLLVGSATGQDSKAVEELKRWYDKLVQPNRIVTPDEGRQAAQEIKKWALTPGALEPEQRSQLLQLEIYAALSVGDAARAARLLRELEREFPDTRDTLRAAWLTACATGDGQLAQQTLERLKEQAIAKGRPLETRSARIRMIGQPAPDAEILTDAGQSVHLRKRNGVVLVIDFWKVAEKPTDRHIAALRGLHDSLAQDQRVAFLGVNSDSPKQLAAARQFAAQSGYNWPQHYEQVADDPPLTGRAFHVKSTPWQVVMDGDGNVRAVGAVTEPEFQYALRAALAESRGEYPAIVPRTTDGKPAAGASAEPPAAELAPEQKKREEPAAEPEPPRHPEAARLLDQARLYLKTGKKSEARKLLQELIEKYPDTWEAREAKRLGLI